MLMRNFIVVLFCFVWSNSMAFSSIVIYLLINCLLLCDVTLTYVDQYRMWLKFSLKNLTKQRRSLHYTELSPLPLNRRPRGNNSEQRAFQAVEKGQEANARREQWIPVDLPGRASYASGWSLTPTTMAALVGRRSEAERDGERREAEGNYFRNFSCTGKLQGCAFR